jgi:hypothetical protein
LTSNTPVGSFINKVALANKSKLEKGFHKTKKMGTDPRTHGIDLKEFQTRFGSDAECIKFIFTVRLTKNEKCACGKDVWQYYRRIKNRKQYRCAYCSRMVSVLSGTPFQNTHFPLEKWFEVLYKLLHTPDQVHAKAVSYDYSCNIHTAYRLLSKLHTWLAAAEAREQTSRDQSEITPGLQHFTKLFQVLPPLLNQQNSFKK